MQIINKYKYYDSIYMSLTKLQELVKDKETWHAAVHRAAKSWPLQSD